MRIESSRTFSIFLHDDEINAIRKIAELAKFNIAESPRQPFIGCPLYRQAGMFGAELNLVNELIDEIISETNYLEKTE